MYKQQSILCISKVNVNTVCKCHDLSGFNGEPFSDFDGDPETSWLFSESLPVAIFLLSLLCVFTCLLRWSERMKRLLHVGHANLFSPVCVRRWRWSSSERVKRFPQNSQLQTNGRSPGINRTSVAIKKTNKKVFREFTCINKVWWCDYELKKAEDAIEEWKL